MKRVEAVVRVERLHKVREGLKELGLGGIILHANGWSKESKFHLRYRGLPVSYDLIPAAKFELFIPDDKLDLVVRTIKENARTGEAGDGVIAVSDLASCINITPMND
ncbi:MAG: P-II family nitrogen regulator [Nitrososphaeraceae archaeon]